MVKFSHLIILLLFLLVLIGPVIAADKIKPIQTIGIIKARVIEVVREPVSYPASSNILAPIERIVGRVHQPSVDVTINNEIVATIPRNSRFNGMEVSKKCLVYQYGTEGWYKCEGDLDEKVTMGLAKVVVQEVQ